MGYRKKKQGLLFYAVYCSPSNLSPASEGFRLGPVAHTLIDRFEISSMCSVSFRYCLSSHVTAAPRSLSSLFQSVSVQISKLKDSVLNLIECV